MLGKQISAEALHALFEQGIPNGIIVDVRTPEEFKKGAISGAKNIPVDLILNHIGELSSYQNIYLYCLSGSRSQLALAQLEAAGLPGELCSLTSGLLAWRKQGFPLNTPS